MKKLNSFIVIFLFTYISLALLAKTKVNNYSEIFPFFSFDLYSSVPSKLNNVYDIQIDRGLPSESLLYYGNKNLKGLKKQILRYKVRKFALNFLETGTIDTTIFDNIKKHKTLHLIRLDGNYKSLAKDKAYISTVITAL